jgi:hypothetical protein
MAIPLRQEYDPGLTRIRGWLALFCGFAFLSILAFLRSAMATVISGSGGGLVSLIIAAVLLVAWIGLLRRKRWSYYLLLIVGFFWLAVTAAGLISAPDQWLFKDWAFDLPVIGEFVITAACLAYLLYSRRVYSVYFGPVRT